MIQSYKELFDNNKKWVTETTRKNPAFFNNLANGQSPEQLWIGLHLHGLVYDVKNGILNDLDVTVEDCNDMDEVYRLEMPDFA